MCLDRWRERCLHPDVQLIAIAAKPHTATLGQLWRLLHLVKSEEVAIEAAYRWLATFGAAHLNVVQESHVASQR